MAHIPPGFTFYCLFVGLAIPKTAFLGGGTIWAVSWGGSIHANLSPKARLLNMGQV